MRNSLPVVKDSGQPDQTNLVGDIREILPHGYVIADQLFFSPSLGLSFTGELKTLKFENNKFRAQEWPGVIQVLQKKSGQDIIDAIKEIVKNEGKNPDDCRFDITEQNNGNAIVEVKAQMAYGPTDNQKNCSAYAVSTGYHDGSYFQFSTEANGSDTFLYVHDEVDGGDASWIGHVDVLVND